MDINIEADINWKGKEAVESVRAGLKFAAEGAAKNMEATAKKLSPVDTGRNRDSIKSEVMDDEDGLKVKLGTSSGYGAYLELGTYKMGAQPFLTPAFEKHKEDIQNILKRYLAGK